MAVETLRDIIDRINENHRIRNEARRRGMTVSPLASQIELDRIRQLLAEIKENDQNPGSDAGYGY